MKQMLASVLALAALAAVSAGAAAPARADVTAIGDESVYELAVQADIVPMRVAVDAALRAHPGSQYVTGRFQGGPQPLYIIRIVTRDGHRRDVRVDARTGRVIG
ncbi:MAG: PepSY domain-containing protein [Oceanicaulis sp.]|nr:PepSY domain-containing protein [Oceanicaulis sp.]